MGLSASSCGSLSKFGCFENILKKRPCRKARILKQVKDCSTEQHVLSTRQVFRQKCDRCTSYIWGKAYVCTSCKMVCHKKCLKHCPTADSGKASPSKAPASSQIFGVPLCALTNETQPMPIVIERLLEHLEVNGLHSEGLYRMSAAASDVRELRQQLETDPQAVSLDSYPIHAVTGLVKQWLRELPEPLVTFQQYHAFLNAMEVPDVSGQVRHISTVMDMLPLPNINAMERLISHMVRVAREEVQNRMTTQALAIVFAPNIIRSPATVDLAEMAKDIGTATMCLELILNERMRLFQTLKEQELKPPADKGDFSESHSVNTEPETEDLLQSIM